MRRPYTLDSRWFESVFSYFLFSLFIKFSSFVHLLLLFLNLFEEQTTVQCILQNYHIHGYKAESVDDTNTREGDVNI